MMDYKEEFDLSFLKQIEKNLTQAGNRHIKYGWLDKSLHTIHGIKRKVPTAQIVFWNEFGTRGNNGKSHIPSRPYLTMTSVSLQTLTVPYVQKFFLDNISNNPFNETALDSLDTVIKTEFKNIKGTGKELSNSTVKKKKHAEHWVETGQMLDEFQVKTYKRKLLES